MGIADAQIRESLDALATIEPRIAAALARAGYPETRGGERGYTTLLRAIIGQQVSVAAAQSMWAKMEDAFGSPPDPVLVQAASDESLRAAGLSRQKAAYARDLAGHVLSGELDFANLPADDEEAIAALTAVKGIGRWTAEIYLLFAEGRRDIWPAGDLAVAIEMGRILGMDEKPGEKALRELAEAWRPHRGALAILAWHHRRAGFAAL